MDFMLLPLETNEYHEYKFELWQMGNNVSQHIFNDLNSARNFYAKNGSSDNFALKLFVDNQLINFLHMSKELKINHKDMWRLHLHF